MGTCAAGDIKRYGGLAAGSEDEQKRYFADKRLYTLQIEAADVCYQGCLYCYAGSTPKEKQGLTTLEIKGLLADAAALQIRAIDWLGGDPLLRRDWYELMLHAGSLGLVNNIWTSGLPLRHRHIAQKVHEVTKNGFVSVHVDSINPDTYALLHQDGNPHYIEHIIQGVDNLLALGKPADRMINCITYTRKQTPEDAIETMRWWFEEKGMRTCLTMFNPSGMGRKWRDQEPSLKDVEEVYKERDRINYGEGVSIGAMDTDKYYCGTMATVTFEGDVTPCSVIRTGVGNIRKLPFREIVAQHLDTLVHGDLHDTSTMPAPCNSCTENAYCWGCRASAFNYNNDANGLDPKCWLLEREG